MESKNQGGTVTTSSYTYDGNGNLLSELDINNAAVVAHTYDGFNQLISTVAGTTTITYTYNAQGIRTSRTVGGTTTDYLLDGGNVVGEVESGTPSAIYIRGANLISQQSSSGTKYYLYNAHGNVVQLTDSTGTVTKAYDYDAFGNEKNPDDADTNPFRYCGEYYDTETGLYYLRARYYDPTVGRFTQEDTHWNTANMIYGDNPQKIHEREDALGLKTYSYAPQILSILQAGNLYVYGVNNPVRFVDPTGNLAWPGEIHQAVSQYLAALYHLNREQIIIYSAPIVKNGRIFTFGRADLISNDGQVWEIKPNKIFHIIAGTTQLDNYVSGKWINPETKEITELRVGEPIADGKFLYDGVSGSYYVFYKYENGLILYEFTPYKTNVNLTQSSQTDLITLGAGGAFFMFIAFGLGDSDPGRERP